MEQLLAETPADLTTFRQWVRRATDELTAKIDNEPDKETYFQVAKVIRRAKRHAFTLGLFGLADKLPERMAKSPIDGLLRLRECARYRIGRKSRAQLTPPQVAKRYGVNPDTVRGWIINGDLRATNIAKAGSTRPQYRIAPEALAEFDRKRIASMIPPTPIARRRPKKSGLSFTRFSQ